MIGTPASSKSSAPTDGNVEAFPANNLSCCTTPGPSPARSASLRWPTSPWTAGTRSSPPRPAPENPAWFYNLKANPKATIEIGTDTVPVTARVASPEEREPIWTRQKQDQPGFAEYEQKTSRQIPVVILEPARS